MCWDSKAEAHHQTHPKQLRETSILPSIHTFPPNQAERRPLRDSKALGPRLHISKSGRWRRRAGLPALPTARTIYIHHYAIIKSIFNALKILCALSIHSPNPLPLVQAHDDHRSLYCLHGIAFLECHVVGIMQNVAFGDCLLSFRRLHYFEQLCRLQNIFSVITGISQRSPVITIHVNFSLFIKYI